jgi:hypothetical protein
MLAETYLALAGMIIVFGGFGAILAFGAWYSRKR